MTRGILLYLILATERLYSLQLLVDIYHGPDWIKRNVGCRAFEHDMLLLTRDLLSKR